MTRFFFIFIYSILCISVGFSETHDKNKELSSLLESYITDLTQVDYTLQEKLTQRIKKNISDDPDALDYYAGNKNYILKICFIRAITKLGNPDYYEKLIPYLNDPETGVVIEAIHALASSHNDIYAEHLRTKCKNSLDDESVLCTALLALGEFSNPDIIDFIYAQYISTSSHTIKHHALLALGKSGVPRAADYLITIYPTAYKEYKIFIIMLLGRFRNHPGAITTLDQILKTATEKKWIIPALSSLGKLESDKHFDTLLKYLDTQDAALFRTAVKAVGDTGKPEAIYALFKALSEHPSTENQTHIYSTIETICALYSLEEIKANIIDLDHPSHIITQLALLGDPSSITILKELLYHEDPLNRIFAIDALVRIASPERAKKLLLQRLLKATPLDVRIMLPIFKRWQSESFLSIAELQTVEKSASKKEPIVICRAALQDQSALKDLRTIIQTPYSAFQWCGIYALAGSRTDNEMLTILKQTLLKGSLINRYYTAKTVSSMAVHDSSLKQFIRQCFETEKNALVIGELQKGVR